MITHALWIECWEVKYKHVQKVALMREHMINDCRNEVILKRLGAVPIEN